MEKLVLNGTLIDRGEASVDIEDRGYQFGDGIYEVVRVYGGRLFTSEMHLKRLYQSAEKLSLHIPYTMEQLWRNWKHWLQQTASIRALFICNLRAALQNGNTIFRKQAKRRLLHTRVKWNGRLKK